jgi:hypothetical protein
MRAVHVADEAKAFLYLGVNPYYLPPDASSRRAG